MKPIEINRCPLVYVEQSVARQICVNDVFVDDRNGKCYVFTSNPRGMGIIDEITPTYLRIEEEEEKQSVYRLSRHFRRVGIIATSPDVAELISAVRESIRGTALDLLPHGSQVDVNIKLPVAVEHIHTTVTVSSTETEETQDE